MPLSGRSLRMHRIRSMWRQASALCSRTPLASEGISTCRIAHAQCSLLIYPSQDTMCLSTDIVDVDITCIGHFTECRRVRVTCVVRCVSISRRAGMSGGQRVSRLYLLLVERKGFRRDVCRTCMSISRRSCLQIGWHCSIAVAVSACSIACRCWV